MHSLQKMYTLVGIVSLLYSGVILPKFSLPTFSFNLKKQALFFKRLAKKITSTSFRKKNKGSCQSNLLDDINKAMKDGALREAGYFYRKANSKFMNDFKNAPDLNAVRKEVLQSWSTLMTSLITLVNEKFSGTKEEKRIKEKIRDLYRISMVNLGSQFCALYSDRSETLDVGETDS